MDISAQGVTIGKDINMTNGKKIGFHYGVVDSGEFVVASVSSPAFCFFGDDEDALIAKARRAINFFQSGEGQVFAPPVSKTKQVVRFVPQRTIEVHLEPA